MPRTRQPNCDMMMSMQNGPCITVSDPLRLNCWFHLSNGTCPSRHTTPGLLQRPSDHSQLSKPQNNGFYLWQTVHWFTIQLPAAIPTWTQCPTTYGCGIGWYCAWEYGPDRQRCWTGKKVAEPHSLTLLHCRPGPFHSYGSGNSVTVCRPGCTLDWPVQQARVSIPLSTEWKCSKWCLPWKMLFASFGCRISSLDFWLKYLTTRSNTMYTGTDGASISGVLCWTLSVLSTRTCSSGFYVTWIKTAAYIATSFIGTCMGSLVCPDETRGYLHRHWVTR